ncbi:MAG: fibronectin type III domain-containing protein [Bacteroidetes bacterium]|nr:fibronectin type III domain-containing protein [Bacteroidota bacterium]
MKQLLILAGAIICLSVCNNPDVMGACNSVTGLTTSNITNVSANLKWTAVSCDSFLVRYNDVANPGAVFYKTVSSGTATSVTITGLYPNTNYNWLIHTYCGGGQSGPYQTTPGTFTTLNSAAYCLVPNMTTASSVTANSAVLNWNTLVSADSFQVKYNVTGTSSFIWVRVAGSQHSYSLSGLLSNTNYTWIVCGFCSGGTTTLYSSSNTFTTLSSSCGTPNVNSFSNNNVTGSSATMGWAAVSGAVSYNVKYAIRYSGNWTTVNSTTTSKNVTGLTGSTWYEFQVQTVCSNGSSAYSSSGIFQTTSSTLSLTRGPYLQLSTTSSIYIKWRTSIASDSKVVYGTTLGTYPYTASNTTSSTEHTIQLTGLSTNTKYFYKIGSTTVTLQGDSSNYFNTNPAAGSTGTVRIWAIGDYGVGTSQQSSVRDAYKNYRGSNYTNVWLSTGDNAYDDGTDAEYTSNVFNYYQEAFKKWVFWPTTGNHDLHSADATAQTGPFFDNFIMPNTGQAGGVASNTEAYYSFNYANIHFVSLESNDASFRSTTGAMATWLNNDLNANTQRWTVVFFHHPPYTKGSHDSDVDAEPVGMRTNIIPILESHKVDLVLSGHSHAYERSYLIKGHFGLENTFTSAMKVSSNTGIYPNSFVKSSPNFDGTVYVVCGASSQVGTTSTGWPHNAMYTSSNTKYGSMAIDVTGDRLDAKFVLSDGSIWDQFTIQKSGVRMAGSVEGSLVNDLSVFPNPSSGQFTIAFPAPKSNTHISVYDINGRQVYYTEVAKSEAIEPVELRINRTEMFVRQGIYFIRLARDEQVITKKLLIED